MALGVEYGCKYVLEGPTGIKAVFNDSTDPNYVGNLNPEGCSGLDSPEVREDAADRTEEDGRTQGNNYFGGRPIILAGTVIATSASDRATKVDKILGSSNAMRADATLTWYPVGEPAGVSVKVRRNQPVRITKNYVKEFQVPLVANDALIYEREEKTAGLGVRVSTKPAGAGANESGTGTVAWINPGNITTSNNVYSIASLAASATSNWLRATGFGHVFPAGAKIIGVGSSVERKKSGGASAVLQNTQHKIIKGGVIGGASRGASPNPTWPTSEASAVVPFEGKALYNDLWGNTLAASDIEASNWGVALSVKETLNIEGGVAEVDNIITNIYFVTPIEVENIGNAGVDFIAEIAVPNSNIVNGPIELLNETTGEKLKIERNLVEGETLVIDTKHRTVTVAGSSVYSTLNFKESSWFKLEPGKTKLFVANAGLTVKYRSGWS